MLLLPGIALKLAVATKQILIHGLSVARHSRYLKTGEVNVIEAMYAALEHAIISSIVKLLVQLVQD